MNAMDFEVDKGNGALSAWRAAEGDDAAGHADEAGGVVFQMTRSGVLKTARGEVRIAALLEIQRRSGGRLVAVLLVAALMGQGHWSLRRFSVPMDMERPGDAARLLGALLPDVLTPIPDGALLRCGDDGVVRAEVLSRSGRPLQADMVEVDLRGATDRGRTGQAGKARVGGAGTQHGLHA